MTLDPSWSRTRAYPIEAGRIAVHSLEVHVTDHCNLRCEQCCVLSPWMEKRFLDPRALDRDLGWAKTVLRPSIFKLTGGEPLLSPHIVEIAQTAKASGIAPVLSLTTNGVLVDRAPDALFETLDALTVSVYPHGGIDEDALTRLHARARRFGVRVNEKRQDRFEEMTRPEPADEAVTRTVFDTCWLRHRCHTLRDGVFYACSRPPSMDRRRNAHGAILHGDGLSLEPRPGLADELAAYLERDRPLASCATCFGATGASIPFRQHSLTDLRLRRVRAT